MTTGGIIHTYQKYDPREVPFPTQQAPDLVTTALEHLLAYGDFRELTDEELARAVRMDPSQIAGLGPSLESLLAMLRERKRKLLAKYETESVVQQVDRDYRDTVAAIQPPRKHQESFRRGTREEQLYDLERLWYRLRSDGSKFARELLHVMNRLGQKYQVTELCAKYTFTGRQPLTVDAALLVKAELEQIDELIRQLEEARKTAQLGIIDLSALSEFVEPGEMERLAELQRQIESYVRDLAEQQGLQREQGVYRITPKAMRLFQGKLLQRIFRDLQSSRTGRHGGVIVGDGSVELPQTRPFEFGDSPSQMDIPQTFVNALLRAPGQMPISLRTDDIVIHQTRNSPKCATAVILDMSGSMRYGGEYRDVKRMALALEGLIRREYPGDVLRFIEMYTFAKVRTASELVRLLPKPVTTTEPWVRLKVDMSREDTTEVMIHPHFTNIQHSLRLARQLLATQDTPNRQIILITDGLPTAHFEETWLYLLYPPDPRTERATMREAMLCQRDGIVLNIFLLSTWSQTREDVRFANRMAASTKGRVFITAGRELDRFVVWDYLARKRELISG